MSDERKVCGAEHPDKPGVRCEREVCVAYHRSGAVVWTQGATPLPSSRPDPIRHNDVARRTRAKARRTDPATSHEAAISLGDLTEAQRAIFRVVSERPRTDEEIYAVLVAIRQPMSPSGCRTRRSELVDAGLIEDSGQHKLTGSGHKSIVWRVKQ